MRAGFGGLVCNLQIAVLRAVEEIVEQHRVDDRVVLLLSVVVRAAGALVQARVVCLRGGAWVSGAVGKMIPRSLDAIVGAAYHQSNSTQLNSNRYVLGQLTAPTRTSLTSDRARAVAVVRALGSPLSPLQGGPGCVPRWGACARGAAQARALRPARLLTHLPTARATTLTEAEAPL